MRRSFIVVLALLLAACASRSDVAPAPVVEAPPPAPSPPPPPPPPPPAPQQSSGVIVEGGIPTIENAQVARGFLVAGEMYKPFRDNLPFGLVLLRRGDTARNNAVCSAFINGIPSTEDALMADPEASIILTYWLLRRPLSGTDLLDCTALLANYDFARAARLRNAYGRAAATGPVFLGLQLNQGLTTPAGGAMTPYVALLDMSGLNAVQTGITTGTWFDQVVTGADDLAAQPAYRAEPKRKGRGWFGKIFALAKSIASGFACDVLKTNTAPATLGITQVAVFDPEYRLAVGAVRLFTQGTKVVGFAANLLADTFCPAVALYEPGQAGLPVLAANSYGLRA